MVRGADKRGDSAEAEGGLYYVLAASDVAKAKTRSVPGPAPAWNDTLQLCVLLPAIALPPSAECRCVLRVTAWAACLVADRDVDHPFGKLEVFLWRELSGGTDQFIVRTFTTHQTRHNLC